MQINWSIDLEKKKGKETLDDQKAYPTLKPLVRVKKAGKSGVLPYVATVTPWVSKNSKVLPMSRIDFTPAQTTATGVRPNSVRSALASMAKIIEMTLSINLILGKREWNIKPRGITYCSRIHDGHHQCRLWQKQRSPRDVPGALSQRQLLLLFASTHVDHSICKKEKLLIQSADASCYPRFIFFFNCYPRHDYGQVAS